MNDRSWPLPFDEWPSDDRAVRRTLLPLTIEWARRAPYYRRRLRGLTRLETFPLLRKDVAVKHAAELLACPVDPFVGVISSGTQFGDREPLRVPDLPDERAALSSFLESRARGERDGHGGLRVEVLSMQHGFPEGPAPADTLRVPWTFTATTFRLLHRLLFEPQRGRWVETLVIGAAAIVPLTAWLCEQGADFSKTRLEAIGTTGFRLAPHAQAFVERTWGAPVYDNFSLSELSTPASECEACGFHHFLWPTLVQEVLDPNTERPARSGILVVTTLWPFVQAMPLVRYWTDDVVDQGPRCTSRGERGFRFRGRRGQCQFVGSQLVLSPQDVEHVIDAFPEVARLPHPTAQLGLVRSVDVGVPRFEVARRGDELEVAVEVRFAPHVFPARTAELEAVFRAALLERATPLRQAVRSGALGLTVRLASPRSLTRAWSKF